MQNNPIRYNDPTGHRICEKIEGYSNCRGAPNKTVIPKDITVWKDDFSEPDWVATWNNIKDDPVELMARALLTEQGSKIGTDLEDDVYGVAWAIRNRHDTVYFDKDNDGIEDELAWKQASVSVIHGMSTPLARDPMGWWGMRFGSQEQMLTAYNRAREIATEVISAPASADITNGATRWSDARCITEKCDQDERGRIISPTTPWNRTHFGYVDKDVPDGTWCIITIPLDQCN